MTKNIVVFSDGTGQEGGQGFNSNVYKLFNMVQDRSPGQIAFYDRGLGTGKLRILGNVSGMGISRNILDCYRFIFENYEAGDRLFLLGFSRGATTVRSLSGFIHMFGILPKSRPELIKQAYGIYKIRDRSRREQRAAEFVARNHTMWTRVRFLGVWDTVAALGVPIQALDVLIDHVRVFRHNFHDLSLSPCVETACHALAIDDERLVFHPVLWKPVTKPHQHMKQVWFSGMHTDVGGGYREPQLSDIALEWMAAESMGAGLVIYPDHKVDMAPDPDGTMHDSRAGALARYYRRKPRWWDSELRGPPTVHATVMQRTLNGQNKSTPPYAPWILGEEWHSLVEPRLGLVAIDARLKRTT